jgi:hypothetical protein
MIDLPRRKFILGALGVIAAPAIVKIASIMPIKSWYELPRMPFLYASPLTGFSPVLTANYVYVYEIFHDDSRRVVAGDLLAGQEFFVRF